MEEMLYTVAETARILKTNVAYVHELRKAKQLKFLKLGMWKVRKQELERFLKDSEGLDLTDPYNPKIIE